MDPKTGKPYPDGQAKPLPRQWPRFSVDEVVELKGVLFTVQRINRSNSVLRPVVVGTQRAKDIIRKITKRTSDDAA